MYNINQRQYMNWADFLKDIAMFSKDFDYDKSFRMSNYSYFKRDGQQVLAGNFAAFVESLKNDLGLKIDPKGCFDMGFTTTILYEDYAGELTSAAEAQRKIAFQAELSQKSKVELLELAKEKGLDVKPAMTKEQILDTISATL